MVFIISLYVLVFNIQFGSYLPSFLLNLCFSLQNIIVYIHIEKIEFTITYVNNDGKNVSSNLVLRELSPLVSFFKLDFCIGAKSCHFVFLHFIEFFAYIIICI